MKSSLGLEKYQCYGQSLCITLVFLVTSPPPILANNHYSPAQCFISLLYSPAHVSKLCRDVSHSFNERYRATSTDILVTDVLLTRTLLHTLYTIHTSVFHPLFYSPFYRLSICSHWILAKHNVFEIYNVSFTCHGNCSPRRFCLYRTTPYRYPHLNGAITLGQRHWVILIMVGIIHEIIIYIIVNISINSILFIFQSHYLSIHTPAASPSSSYLATSTAPALTAVLRD